MKEYTLIAVSSVIITILVDWVTDVHILRQKFFYLFLGIVFLFKLGVNGYLTGTNIVLYDPRFFLGIRLGSIPCEDFLFGFSMVTMGVVFWEYFKRGRK